MQQLSPRNREKLALYIIEYALNETEPNLRNSTLAAVFATIRPILDKARMKAMSGKSGGEASGESRSKIEAKSKQNGSKTQAKGEREKEEEIESEFKVEGGERDGAIDVQIPQKENMDLDRVFEVLSIFNVAMEDKDRADCRLLCAKYGTTAVIEAVKTADFRHVPRWSYIRAIVTSGGVGSQRKGRGHIIGHDDPPGPAAMSAIRDMLDWDEKGPMD